MRGIQEHAFFRCPLMEPCAWWTLLARPCSSTKSNKVKSNQMANIALPFDTLAETRVHTFTKKPSSGDIWRMCQAKDAPIKCLPPFLPSLSLSLSLSFSISFSYLSLSLPLLSCNIELLRDWVKLAVTRARASNTPGKFPALPALGDSHLFFHWPSVIPSW